MAEYIDREAAEKELLYAMVGTGYQSRAIDAIRFMPTADVVEVVRCKDCVWRIEIPNGTEFKGIKPRYCGLKQELTGENDYCSKGAKMDGKGEGE